MNYPEDTALEKAEEDLRKAERELDKGRADEAKGQAEITRAEEDVDRALHEIEEARHTRPRNVEVTVDNVRKAVEAGSYLVAAFKKLVGVPADKELDRVEDGGLVALSDDASISIEHHEVFISHVRTGGSS